MPDPPPEILTLVFSAKAIALRELVREVIASGRRKIPLSPNGALMLLGEPLPEPVQRAFGPKPSDCPDPVWRMLVAAADLAEALTIRQAQRGVAVVPFEAKDFRGWAEEAWREATR